jgi:protein disulfide-isomerase A6
LQSCQKKVCLIAFLPHILDSKVAGRQKYLKEFQGVAQKMASTPVNFLWVQGKKMKKEHAIHF